jgi:hypothetical protein
MAKRKRTNNDLQNITHKTKDTVTYQSYGTPIFLETLTSNVLCYTVCKFDGSDLTFWSIRFNKRIKIYCWDQSLDHFVKEHQFGSVLEYGSVVWGLYLTRDIDKLERIHRNGTRFITGDYKTTEFLDMGFLLLVEVLSCLGCIGSWIYL